MWEEIDEDRLPLDAWEHMVDQEFSVFKKGEKYSYIKDMQDAFAPGQSTSMERKIFKTIPDHVFWDIKKPLREPEDMVLHPYNPARKYPFESFFDRRNYEQWRHDRATNLKIKDDVSRHRRY